MLQVVINFEELQLAYFITFCLFLKFVKDLVWQKSLPPTVHSTSWKFSRHFIYTFRTAWLFLTKTWSSDPSYFDTPILDISNTCACASRNYWLLHTIYINMIKSWSLHWGSSLINEAGYQFCQFGHLTFSKKLFWSVNCALSC